MLSNEQLKIIMDKEEIDVSDLILLDEHIAYIGGIQDEYGDTLDEDVFYNLQNDLELIIAKLNTYLESKGILFHERKSFKKPSMEKLKEAQELTRKRLDKQLDE